MDYMNLATSIVSSASAQGVEAEALVVDSRETEIRLSEGKVEKLTQSGSCGVGVRVIADGRVGYAYTSNLSPDSIEQTWRSAIDLSVVATPDPNRALPDPMKVSDEDLDIWDAKLAALPTEAKVAFLQRVEKSAFDYDPRIKLVPFCVYEDGITTKYLANSKGFSGQYGKTYAVATLQVVGVDGDERAEAWDLGASVCFSDLSAEQIGLAAARRVLTMLGGKPVPTQTCTVVFDALVTAEILFYLSLAVEGERLQKKRSFLLDQLGQDVGADTVSLMDNGRLKRSLGSRPFDDEGVPTSATRLIDEGTFRAVLHDSYSARRAGTQSTGNATRGSHRQVPTVGVNHLYLQPGHKSVDELIAGVQNGLYVTHVMQTGGIDPTNGDCSMAAYGMWIENGKLTRPVSGVTVATTLQALLKNISDVGNDLRPVPMMGTISAPTIRVESVTVGGLKENGSR